MTVSPHEILAFAVRVYDEREEPLTPSAVADRFGLTAETATERLDRLADCELLAPESDGFRPTVTARELLALDIDDEFVVVDASDDR
jgi:DNA-binding IclR family transcriptional regulator